MKKVCCMIALAAISFGSVYAAVPARSVKATAQTDTTKMKMKKKKMKMKTDTSKMKMKMKKDTSKM
jgi:hypothetical protein